MRAWITLPRRGTGTAADPFRPNLGVVAGIDGVQAPVFSPVEVLTLVSGTTVAITAVKALSGAIARGDERADGTLTTANRTAVVNEATRLGATGLRPEGYRFGRP
jgi:hypothetical protein